MVSMWRWSLLCLPIIVLLARPDASPANTFETYGFGSRPISMGGAYTAVADDFGATYYNPAGLPQIGQVDMGVGMGFLTGRLKSVENVVVGETTEGGPVLGDIDPQLSDNGGFMGGIAVGITERLAMGIGIYVPSNRYLAKLQSQRQREPHFIWYEKRPRHFSLLVAVGVEVMKGLSIGAGADILFGPQGGVVLRIPPGGEAKIDLGLTFMPRLSPYGGLLYEMTDNMSLGLVYREEKQHGKLDLSIDALISLQQLALPILGKMDGLFFYSPRQVALGWAWEPTQKLHLSFDLIWVDWSSFRDATIDFVVAVGGDLYTQQFEQVLAPGFHDTLMPRMGLEYLAKTLNGFSWSEAVEVRVRGGYYFMNSPVPEQTGITNYMDSDTHVFSAGLAAAILKPFGTSRTFNVNLHLQIHHLANREHTKDSEMADINGDGIPEIRIMGYPGYVTGGQLFAGGFTVGVSF